MRKPATPKKTPLSSSRPSPTRPPTDELIAKVAASPKALAALGAMHKKHPEFSVEDALVAVWRAGEL